MKSLKLISAMAVVALVVTAGLTMGSAADVQLLTTAQMGSFEGADTCECDTDGEDLGERDCQQCFYVTESKSLQYDQGNVGRVCTAISDYAYSCTDDPDGLDCNQDNGEWVSYGTPNCTGEFTKDPGEHLVDTAYGDDCPQ